MKLDLHIHSVYSDGCCTPEEIASRIKALGLHGFAITDHNKVGSWKRAAEAAKNLGLLFVPGVELAVYANSKQGKGSKPIKYGELLALFLNEEIRIKQVLSNLPEIIDEIHDQGGIAAIPHPMGDNIRVQMVTDYAKEHKLKIDAIETINGRCSAMQNARSMEYALKEKKAQIGGSDAHHRKEIGTVYTFAEAYSLEDFRKCIKKGLSKAIGVQKSPAEINYNRVLCRFNYVFRGSKLEAGRRM